MVVTGSSSLRRAPGGRPPAAHGAPRTALMLPAAGAGASTPAAQGSEIPATQVEFTAMTDSRRIRRRPPEQPIAGGPRGGGPRLPAGGGRPRAGRHHRRPRHGPGRHRRGRRRHRRRGPDHRRLPAAQPDRAGRRRATCGRSTGCARSRSQVAAMDADERAAVMARARWKAREDAPETADRRRRPGCWPSPRARAASASRRSRSTWPSRWPPGA